jgi:hypothetical protein
MRYSTGLTLAILAGLALFHAPVMAANEGEELDRIYLRTGKGTRDLARMVDCLINRNPQAARELFAHVSGSPEEAVAMQTFFENGGSCLFMTWQLGTSGLMARGAVAEKLIAADRLVEIIDPPAVPSIKGGGSYSWQWRNLSPESALKLVPVADCLVARHGARVKELLATKPTSPGERKVFNSMRGEISACIPAGERIVLQPQILRAAIATSYYIAAHPAGTVRADS